MIFYELRYYSKSQELSLNQPLSAATLYHALLQAHRFDVSDASDKFGTSLWVCARTPSSNFLSVGELGIRNSQGTIPPLPLSGLWRSQISTLLQNLDPQLDGAFLRELHRQVLAQVMGVLTFTKALDSQQASALLAVHNKLDQLLSVHKAVSLMGPIEFSHEIESLLQRIRNICPNVPEKFEFNVADSNDFLA
jgi:hypothetical protein